MADQGVNTSLEDKIERLDIHGGSNALSGDLPRAMSAVPASSSSTSKDSAPESRTLDASRTRSEAAVALLPKEPVTCHVTGHSLAGSKDGFKKTNQDALFFMRTEDKRSLLFGVLDGHGENGHKVSRFLKDRLPRLLMDHPKLLVDTPAAFYDSITEAHRLVTQKDSGVDCTDSGSTAVLAHVFGRRLTVAWVGDSRAVLGTKSNDGTLAARALTVDHKPELEGEKKRIEENKGFVYREVDEKGEDIGPFRVWMTDPRYGGLAMSRSIGDEVSHAVGVSSEPETCSHDLCPSDELLLIASDGVWEWITNEEAVLIVQGAKSIDIGVKKLIQEAKSRWQKFDPSSYVDDVTAVLIKFTHNEPAV